MKMNPNIAQAISPPSGRMLRIGEALGAKKHVLQAADEWRLDTLKKVESMQEKIAVPAGIVDLLEEADHEAIEQNTGGIASRLSELEESLRLMDPDFDEIVSEAEIIAGEAVFEVTSRKGRVDLEDYPQELMDYAYNLRDQLNDRNEGGADALRRRLAMIDEEFTEVLELFPDAEEYMQELVTRIRSERAEQ